jgi:hypothetical protein
VLERDQNGIEFTLKEDIMQTQVKMTPSGTIQNLPHDLILVNYAPDTEVIQEHFGYPPELQYHSFFVRVENGHYAEVYAFDGCIPNLSKAVVKVELK